MYLYLSTHVIGNNLIHDDVEAINSNIVFDTIMLNTSKSSSSLLKGSHKNKLTDGLKIHTDCNMSLYLSNYLQTTLFMGMCVGGRGCEGVKYEQH